MYEYVISFIMAFIIAFSATPIAIKLAFKLGAVDVPKDSRRMHKKAMPLMGGLAIVLAFILTLLFNVILSNLGFINTFLSQTPKMFFGFMGGLLIIIFCGVIDDIFHLRAKYKFLFQLAAAALVVLTGTKIDFFTNPWGKTPAPLPGYLSIVISIFFVVGITNAINFIDGLDGLAAGVCSIASLSLFFVSIILGNEFISVSILTAILAGSSLGFLPYNFNPAKIFMGETGSAFLGFTLAVISIQGTLKVYATVAIVAPILVLGLPLFDTTFSILRRTISGRSIAEADRGHLHHRLVDMGLSQRQSVIIMYTASAVLGLGAIVLADKGELPAIILIISVAIVIIGGSLFLGELNLTGAQDSTIIKLRENIVKFIKKKNTGDILKVIVVFGTRPDAIKMIPLAKELSSRDNIESVICVTGQHRQMLDQVLDIFGVKPDYDLNIMKENQSLQYITTAVLEELTEVIKKENPDIILVHGDTTTCFGAALAGYYCSVPIGHVEAGLRTFDKYSPFPEEMNRKLTGAISELHFSPTQTNKQNLLNEGIPEDMIYITGNTVIDALRFTVDNDYIFENEVLKNIDFDNKKIISVTAHRRENLGEPLENICGALRSLADEYEDVEIIYPVHLNPAVKEVANRILESHSRIHLIEPVGVKELHNLLSRSYMVMTDSGGLQEEVPSLGKPVLVLRNDTERPEAVKAGTVKLIGTEKDVIIKEAKKLFDDRKVYLKMTRAINPYGDGLASERITDALLYEFGLSEDAPEDWATK